MSPPLAQERLERHDEHRVRYLFERAWEGRHARVVLEPLDLLAHLAVLVPMCIDAVDSCLSSCTARARGVSGLCALCLLQGGPTSSCLPGELCCPSATASIARSAADCASVCN